jgi:hypothetical protein
MISCWEAQIQFHSITTFEQRHFPFPKANDFVFKTPLTNLEGRDI